MELTAPGHAGNLFRARAKAPNKDMPDGGFANDWLEGVLTPGILGSFNHRRVIASIGKIGKGLFRDVL